ncbi:hypothetical protein [Nocardia sp. alder85J]|uniref:hypothetical protein n=1 Tax=Nocardia sp. alder85J TaxID=2862949 RepID=UPI001CD4DC8C|nr:hypothetical protein [Nocardia sp. alder85J]MCX4094145.1 hypothetical protein [Nocardia sp. alder85J]
MSQSTDLGTAFENALSTAADLDKQGIFPQGDNSLFPDRRPTNVEIVEASARFYHEHQAVLDRAVDDARNFLDSPDGIAYVKALEGSFDSAEPNPLSAEIAAQILHRGEFDLGMSQPQGLRGFGIGVSVGASAVVGVLAGADLVFDFEDRAEVIPRTWLGVSVKGGLSVSAGLEMSFWFDKPLTGAIAGWLLDIYIPNPRFKLTFFLRFMYITQRPEGATGFEFAGVSVQLPFGIGFPYRPDKGKDLLIALFGAHQEAASRTRGAVLDVVNKATNLATIAVAETATLQVTLNNTGGDIQLSSGATMTIGMPSYFTNDDVTAMTITYAGWKSSTTTGPAGGLSLLLTLTQDYTWEAGADIVFAIGDVRSSNQPPYGQQSRPGQIVLTVKDDTSLTNPIVSNSDFALVWANSEATVSWSTQINTTQFTLAGDSSGTVDAYAQPGYQVVVLTAAKDNKDGTVWELGYQFNYNTAVPDTVLPQIRAVWQKKGSPKTPNTYWQGTTIDPASPAGTSSTANYGGSASTGSSITIKATFG